MVSKTWHNEEKNRWEMDPVAIPFAVSKKLVEHARIRHDWAAMYIALKGDDKEYYVDIKVRHLHSLFNFLLFVIVIMFLIFKFSFRNMKCYLKIVEGLMACT